MTLTSKKTAGKSKKKKKMFCASNANVRFCDVNLSSKPLILIDTCFITCISKADAKSNCTLLLHPSNSGVPTYIVQAELPYLLI